jgi:hypothetical protein
LESFMKRMEKDDLQSIIDDLKAQLNGIAGRTDIDQAKKTKLTADLSYYIGRIEKF